MKKKMTLALATLVAIASLTQAQTQDHIARVNVPFAFDCGSEHFEAGAYTINIDGNKLVALHNAAGTSSGLAVINWRYDSGSPSATASLTFRKYGDTYFLAEYSTSGATFSLIESKKERSVAHEYALNKAHPALAQVAALGK